MDKNVETKMKMKTKVRTGAGIKATTKEGAKTAAGAGVKKSGLRLRPRPTPPAPEPPPGGGLTAEQSNALRQASVLIDGVVGPAELSQVAIDALTTAAMESGISGDIAGGFDLMQFLTDVLKLATDYKTGRWLAVIVDLQAILKDIRGQ